MTDSQSQNQRQLARQQLCQALAQPLADFHPGQWEAIDALVNRREKLLVVQRTGWGKSMVYFIAARLLRDRGSGPTLIVSPLLALMRNQIEAAERLGIRALTINSANRSDWSRLTRAILNDEADAVLISPERLANDEFVRTVLLPITQRLGLLVVDEAHCISDWGHDFRPDYRRLVNILRRMPPNMPVLGTTATANNRVLTDISQQLGDINIQRGSLMRETLALQTLRLPDQAARLAWLAEHLPELPGTGIVYTLTRRDAEQVADWLNQNGISALAYHSDSVAEGFADANAYRQHLETLLLTNQIKALVATTALGMGYDKPDLGFVVHYQAPGSIIAYYQQVGRAGRAIAYAVGILLAGREDAEIHDFFRESAFPDEIQVNAILHALDQSDGLTVIELEAVVNLRRSKQIEHVLKFLSVENPAPVIKDGSRWRRTPVAYRLDHERIRRLTLQREQEWREVQAYIDSPDCLMRFLATALDDENPQPCGQCARCLRQPVVGESASPMRVVQAARYLRRSELALECKKQVANGAFTVYPFRGNLAACLRAETGRVLSYWGDAGWGRRVAEDKRAGYFCDELVEALAEMIQQRWCPQPAPVWVTCVPSRLHPNLVPDFACRLAARLQLPFVSAVIKVQNNQPQKSQQNRYHQCRNLDGAFAVGTALPTGPVLLVDDMVDSTWTLTVVAALLRQAGSGPVWPVALATTAGGGDY
ncbi:RecQ family ATP-dependent DNA helicase [Candidatus Contendibacter odensensis]|uniref:DNA 3'-5' helicase n=1 Tax=Candidatus Contendobacter odensis Run_B_J11 TaxID=1400861 RepID=A0A7U7J5N0_9GAMM|nr:RecQ family ATP-dependent DNA helicase [Candidatus Contendobacter odensis]CDH46592.1 ATP-dependent DNA helicase RecQ [Candidatus Contendobacter odensis Run_B_J11]